MRTCSAELLSPDGGPCHASLPQASPTRCMHFCSQMSTSSGAAASSIAGTPEWKALTEHVAEIEQT